MHEHEHVDEHVHDYDYVNNKDQHVVVVVVVDVVVIVLVDVTRTRARLFALISSLAFPDILGSSTFKTVHDYDDVNDKDQHVSWSSS